MILLKCKCGNHEDFKELLLDFDSKRKEIMAGGSSKFKIKVSRHHKIHIDCKQCGDKFALYDI